MSYQISDETKKQTLRCTSNFKCLNDDYNRCSILKGLEKTLIVKFPKNFLCPYSVSYGDLFFCLCPTRHELYNRHSI